jgi:hypothetical protein
MVRQNFQAFFTGRNLSWTCRDNCTFHAAAYDSTIRSGLQCSNGFSLAGNRTPTRGLVAVMFGTRYMALLYGVVFLGHQMGSFSGVWLGGRLYDVSGSYDMVWWLGGALSLVAAIVHWPISEVPVARLVEQRQA